ncbi:hypothetical protein [Aquimarina macrocephali]|uniref:hypothetical protein n=1 Tax=Aquimarina macrocephali TaxID=666563 RepID=UPI003F67302C
MISKKNDSLYVSLENNNFIKPNEIINKEDSFEFFEKCKTKVVFSKNWLNKHLKMDEWLGSDKEGIVTELRKSLKK